MKNIKRRIIMVVALVISTSLLVGCTTQSNQPKNIPSEDVVDTFIATNQYLEKNTTNIQGEVLLDVSLAASYQGSTAQLKIASDNDENTVSYRGALSLETVLYVLDQITNSNTQNQVALSIDLAAVENTYKLTENGNGGNQFLKFNDDALTPFFKTNSLYFETHENKVSFGEMVNKNLVSTDINKVEKDGTSINEKVITIKTEPGKILNGLPLISNFQSENTNMNIKLYQYEGSETFHKCDIVLYEYVIKDKSGTAQFSANFTLSLDLGIEV